MEMMVDAHLHFVPQDDYFDSIAIRAGHVNDQAHLRNQYQKLGISRGIVMGNRGLELERHKYPQWLSYCIGLDSKTLVSYESAHGKAAWKKAADLVEQHLKQDACVGIKLYPGYNPVYITDHCYEAFYDLAGAYNKPVAVHTGETAGPNALLCYSHPLTVDEAAVSHPQVQFVMCHFGNPWLSDAAAVMSKNKNVAADLSGLLEGRVNVHCLLDEKSNYMAMLRAWLEYIGFQNVMFGTDWPLVNLEDYITFIRRLVPERFHKEVFYENACRIYGLKEL